MLSQLGDHGGHANRSGGGRGRAPVEGVAEPVHVDARREALRVDSRRAGGRTEIHAGLPAATLASACSSRG